MTREAVLVVEHEAPMRTFLERQLGDDGFEVLAAERGCDALELAERTRPSLILLDPVLPDLSGFELCSRLREGEPGRVWDRDVPVIMVSLRSEPADRVRGFARGCDDYVGIPFVYEELLARVRAVLRRAAGPRRPVVVVDALEIDLASRTVKVGGRQVELSAKEYELLVALAQDPERVFCKDELLRDVWGFRSMGSKQHKSPIDVAPGQGETPAHAATGLGRVSAPPALRPVRRSQTLGPSARWQTRGGFGLPDRCARAA